MYIWLKICFLFLVLILYPRQVQEAMIYPNVQSLFILTYQMVETPKTKEIPLLTKLPLAVVSFSGKQEIIDYITQLWGNEANIAIAVFTAESGLNPNAIGDHNLDPHSVGVAQIRAFPSRGTQEQLLDWKYNVDVAYQLYLTERSWNHWTQFVNGNYLKFLNNQEINL